MKFLGTDLVKEGRSAFEEFGPSFTYTNGILSRVDYSDGSFKVLTYLNNLLTQIDHVANGVTRRKIFNYSDNKLISITDTLV